MLRLTRISRHDNLRKYAFEEYSRPDYCVRAVTILTDSEFNIQGVRFNSARHGVVAFSHERGLTESVAWQDETEARAISGHEAYYTVSGLAHKAADNEAVIADVLSAAPSANFTEFVRSFVGDTHRSIAYPCRDYRLELPRTTGQIKVLRYRKNEISRPPEERVVTVGDVWRSMKRAFLRAINRIEYQCPSCLRTNPFLAKECWDCHAPRPDVSWHEILVLFLRAMVGATYLVYLVLLFGFLLSAYIVVARLMRPY